MSNKITESIIVKGDVSTLYTLWNNFENFPQFMKNIKSVTVTGPKTSHWVMAGPAGINVDWHAEKTLDEPNKRIAWNSKNKAGLIASSGQVTFNDLSKDETEVTVTVQYSVPAGKIGETVASVIANPQRQVIEDLRNFKSFAEGMNDRRTS